MTTSRGLRVAEAVRRDPLEPVLPDFRGARQGATAAVTGRGEELMGWIYETSREAPFIVATTEAPSYRRVVLERPRADGLTPTQMKRGGVTARVRDPRRPRHPVRLQHRRYLPGRLPAAGGRQRAPRPRGRSLPQRAAVPSPARPGASRRPLRLLRIPRALRRLPCPRLRGHWRSAGVGPVLRVSAALGTPTAVATARLRSSPVSPDPDPRPWPS
jgi:hypothetical protein